MKSLLCLLALIFLPGCIVVPFPYTTTKNPRLTGKVVDATTRKPIAGAAVQAEMRYPMTVGSIEWSNRFSRPKLTGADGQFLFPKGSNLHLIRYANPSWGWNIPPGWIWAHAVKVTKEGYEPNLFTVQSNRTYGKRMETERELGVIPLTKAGRSLEKTKKSSRRDR